MPAARSGPPPRKRGLTTHGQAERFAKLLSRSPFVTLQESRTATPRTKVDSPLAPCQGSFEGSRFGFADAGTRASGGYKAVPHFASLSAV